MTSRLSHVWHACTVMAVIVALPQKLQAQPSQIGQWGAPTDLKLTSPGPGDPTDVMRAIHAVLLHTGKVLCIDFNLSYPEAQYPNIPDAVLFNPIDESVELVWSDASSGLPNGHELYCS